MVHSWRFFARAFALVCGWAPGMQLAAITVDGDTADWGDAVAFVADATADGARPGADFAAVYLTHDALNLYVRVDFVDAVLPSDSGLMLYVDSDGESATGFPYSGLGVDLTWDLDRSEGVWLLGQRENLRRGLVVQLQAPYAATHTIELSIALAAIPTAVPFGSVKLALFCSDSLDRIPELGQSIEYHLDGNVWHQPVPISTHKMAGNLRLITWNVIRDAHLFSAANEARLQRVLRALDPDIIHFQELYTTSTGWMRNFLQQHLPPEPGALWYVVKNHDCITASLLPITRFESVDGNLVAEIDTTDRLGRRLITLNAHTPCCDNVDGRLQESDRLMAVLQRWLTEARSAGAGPLPAVLSAGDFNTGGYARELLTLVNGDFASAGREDFHPDPAGGPLAFATPRHILSADHYTWRALSSATNGTRLDYIFYSASSLHATKAFVLDTEYLDPATLAALRLDSADTRLSDHLPVIFDFRSAQFTQTFGGRQPDVNGWTDSPLLGLTQLNAYPWIDSAKHGVLWAQSSEGTAPFWFYSSRLGWWWATAAAAHWIYSPRWGWLGVPDTEPVLNYYQIETGGWLRLGK